MWSPDGRWIAYAKRLPTQLHAVFVYDTESGRVHQVTDGLADAYQPAWDRSRTPSSLKDPHCLNMTTQRLP